MENDNDSSIFRLFDLASDKTLIRIFAFTDVLVEKMKRNKKKDFKTFVVLLQQ